MEFIDILASNIFNAKKLNWSISDNSLILSCVKNKLYRLNITPELYLVLSKKFLIPLSYKLNGRIILFLESKNSLKFKNIDIKEDSKEPLNINRRSLTDFKLLSTPDNFLSYSKDIINFLELLEEENVINQPDIEIIEKRTIRITKTFLRDILITSSITITERKLIFLIIFIKENYLKKSKHNDYVYFKTNIINKFLDYIISYDELSKILNHFVYKNIINEYEIIKDRKIIKIRFKNSLLDYSSNSPYLSVPLDLYSLISSRNVSAYRIMEYFYYIANSSKNSSVSLNIKLADLLNKVEITHEKYQKRGASAIFTLFDKVLEKSNLVKKNLLKGNLELFRKCYKNNESLKNYIMLRKK
jgi:hypothetical protein